MTNTRDLARIPPNTRTQSQQDPFPDPTAMSRSNSSNSSREVRLRPKSRGSTTSLQSVGVGNAFQPQQTNISAEQQTAYMQHAQPHMQGMYSQQRPDEGMMQYQHQFAQMHQSQQMMDHTGVVFQHHDARPHSQQGFHPEMQHYGPHFMNTSLPFSSIQHQQFTHIRHHSEQYEGSPAPEDSNNENGGAKRRKGAASSMANDAELKRLLEQHGSRSLKDIANEVQTNEGSGGKAEKAKQVFAMLWLRDNCQKSSNSVRRDRVFARYTERCGNERVPTLNPASFGKLVRIIFPNVQTRRLGVRGESKYHYVDLSLVPEEEQSQPYTALERPSTAGSTMQQQSRPSITATAIGGSGMIDETIGYTLANATESMETADFPAPTSNNQPRPMSSSKKIEPTSFQVAEKMDCRYLNTPTIRIPTAYMSQNLINHLPAIRSNLPATMATYLAMPSENSLSQPDLTSQDTPIELPDIHEYLAGTKYDHHIAKLLADLYRSHCIDVIDAFRKCKEKSFFSHHSAFNGKMTVPVSKVFTMECVAPWIQECDMRMYKQIVRFLAPLAQQDVPDSVWRSFKRISSRLVGHLVAAFEEKCPVHVVAAKVVPAARFATLLRKLQGANAAALKVNQLLDHPEHRTQMWLDLMVHLDPEGIMDDSTPPPECLVNVRGILMHDFRTLLAPVDDVKHLVAQADNDPESAYADFLSDPVQTTGVLPLEDRPVSLLYRWIQWLEKLPAAFEGHHSQCMMDWHSRFWRSIMAQLLTNDAISYSAWLGLESFATQMLAYITQMEGFLLDGRNHKLLDQKEDEKKEQDEELQQQHLLKRKRGAEDVGGDERSLSRRNSAEPPVTQPVTSPAFPLSAISPTNAIDESDADMDELRQGGPLDLPTFRTGFSSPVKHSNDSISHQPDPNVDDSGIGLVLGDHEDHDTLAANKDLKQYNKRDWLLSSDPVEPGMAAHSLIV